MNRGLNAITFGCALTLLAGCGDQKLNEEGDPQIPEINDISDSIVSEVTDSQNGSETGSSDSQDAQEDQEVGSSDTQDDEETGSRDTQDDQETEVIEIGGSIQVTVDATPCFVDTFDPDLCENGWDGGNQRIIETLESYYPEVLSLNICRPYDDLGPEEQTLSSYALNVSSDGDPAMVIDIFAYVEGEEGLDQIHASTLWVPGGNYGGMDFSSNGSVDLVRGDCLKMVYGVDRNVGEESQNPNSVQLRVFDITGPDGALVDAEYDQYDGRGPLVIFELTRNLIFHILDNPTSISASGHQANDQDAYLWIAQVSTSGSNRTERPFIGLEVTGVPGTELHFERHAFSSFFGVGEDWETVSMVISDDGVAQINLPFPSLNEEINGDESSTMRIKIASEDLDHVRGNFTVRVTDFSFEGDSGHENNLVNEDGEPLDAEAVPVVDVEIVD